MAIDAVQPTSGAGWSAANTIAANAITEARREMAASDAPAALDRLPLTRKELAELDTLAYYLGAGLNACVSFAVKWACCHLLETKAKFSLPRPARASKNNPLESFEYKLTPEAKTILRRLQQQPIADVDTSTDSFVRAALAAFCKKLLPTLNSRGPRDA